MTAVAGGSAGRAYATIDQRAQNDHAHMMAIAASRIFMTAQRLGKKCKSQKVAVTPTRSARLSTG